MRGSSARRSSRRPGCWRSARRSGVVLKFGADLGKIRSDALLDRREADRRECRAGRGRNLRRRRAERLELRANGHHDRHDVGVLHCLFGRSAALPPSSTSAAVRSGELSRPTHVPGPDQGTPSGRHRDQPNESDRAHWILVPASALSTSRRARHGAASRTCPARRLVFQADAPP